LSVMLLCSYSAPCSVLCVILFLFVSSSLSVFCGRQQSVINFAINTFRKLTAKDVAIIALLPEPIYFLSLPALTCSSCELFVRTNSWIWHGQNVLRITRGTSGGQLCRR
jgi:hypothetical protein